MADEVHLANELECRPRVSEELLLEGRRRALPDPRVLVDPFCKKADHFLPHTRLVHEGDLGPRRQAEAEHSLSRAPKQREVVRVVADLVALDDAVVLLLEDGERVLEREVLGELLVNALV